MIKKILVADDSITIQKIVAMAFEKEDAVVEGVSDGKDALDKVKDFQPNIVLADVDMPGLTGFELSKKIKDDPKLNFTKVLLLASDFEDFSEKLFKDSGADDHISKPFKSDDIIKRVVVVKDEIVIRPMMYLAFSYDHRIIDGKESVGFLIKIKELLENPSSIVLGI